jgi:hypothetical protein
MVSLSAVELCVHNAERLLLDATKTSPPTAAALAELSLEEAAKGWMLYFRLIFQGRKSRVRIRMSPKESKVAVDFLDSKAVYLEGLDGEIFLAFKWHKVKLRFLAFLLEYLELALPVLVKRARTLKITQELHGPAFAVNEAFGTPDLEVMLRLIRSFRRDHLTELGEVKERGLYVNLSNSGVDLISPEIQPSAAPLLGSLAEFLIVALKGNLVLLTK